jgi:hypothetical protein
VNLSNSLVAMKPRTVTCPAGSAASRSLADSTTGQAMRSRVCNRKRLIFEESCDLVAHSVDASTTMRPIPGSALQASPVWDSSWVGGVPRLPTISELTKTGEQDPRFSVLVSIPCPNTAASLAGRRRKPNVAGLIRTRMNRPEVLGGAEESSLVGLVRNHE